MKKPKKWTWDKWCEHQEYIGDCFHKEHFHANAPYIEWLESENEEWKLEADCKQSMWVDLRDKVKELEAKLRELGE
ncbi:MAG: hypothetical protein ACPG5Z_00290 [Pseudoalteromonas sp.]